MITSLQGSDHSDPETGFMDSIKALLVSSCLTLQGSAMGTGITLLCVCSAPRVFKACLTNWLNRIMLQNASKCFKHIQLVLTLCFLYWLEYAMSCHPSSYRNVSNRTTGRTQFAPRWYGSCCKQCALHLLGGATKSTPGIACFLFFSNRVQSR